MNFLIRQHSFQTCEIVKRFSLRLLCLPMMCLLMMQIRPAVAQEVNRDTLHLLQYYFEDVRQSDQHLIHGTRYYELYPNAPGNSFMEPNEFKTGSVIINTREYIPVKLKYDICNQRLLMSYPTKIGGYGEIMLIHDFIRGFVIGEKIFRIHSLPKKGNQFCQEIGTGSIKNLYFFHKELIPLNNSLESFNQYTQENKDSYLFMDGQIFSYNGKKSFLHLFPEQLHHDIKSYMKENKISLRHISDNGINDLIRFCTGLLGRENNEIRANP